MKAHPIRPPKMPKEFVQAEDFIEMEKDFYEYTIYKNYIIRMKPGGKPEISQELEFEQVSKNSKAYQRIMNMQ